jgi:Protein of unknown function (DUF3237)
MRLEPLCRITMRYTDASWHRPYGSNEDAEAVGFGQGDGEVTGEVEGNVIWANYPRRRQDGVWTPNARGVIRTRGGDELLLSINGQSVQERTESGYGRAILARVELTTEAERYRWLNTCFLVGEGEIDEESEELWIDTYVCVNEQAQGPPALGAEPPERFRQRGAGGPA